MISERIRKNLWFAYLSILLCWAGNAYFEILRYLREGVLFARLINGRPYINDFVNHYNAANQASECLRGHAVDIYDPFAQNLAIAALTAPVVPELNFFFQYPPQFFALVAPLAGLGLAKAWIVWSVLALVLICAALWHLSADFASRTFSRAFVFVAFFASFPAWLSFELGQTSLYQFAFLAAFWLLLKRERYFVAGLESALLLVKLQYVPVIVSTGLLIGRFRFLLGSLLSTSVLGVLTVIVVGLKNVWSYPNALLHGETSKNVSGVSAFEMQNIRGELILLLGQEDRLVHTAALAFLGAGILLLCALWFWGYPQLQKLAGRSKNFAFDVCASITTISMLIVSPHTHTQDYLCIAISCVFLFQSFDLWNAQSRRMKMLRALIVSFPFLSWIFFIGKFLFKLICIQPFFFWAIGVLSIVLFELWPAIKTVSPARDGDARIT